MAFFKLLLNDVKTLSFLITTEIYSGLE